MGFLFSFQNVCDVLKHASRLVPHSQEHMVIKLCQLIHHLLNQLKVTTTLHVCRYSDIQVMVSYIYSLTGFLYYSYVFIY